MPSVGCIDNRAGRNKVRFRGFETGEYRMYLLGTKYHLYFPKMALPEISETRYTKFLACQFGFQRKKLFLLAYGPKFLIPAPPPLPKIYQRCWFDSVKLVHQWPTERGHCVSKFEGTRNRCDCLELEETAVLEHPRPARVPEYAIIIGNLEFVFYNFGHRSRPSAPLHLPKSSSSKSGRLSQIKPRKWTCQW